MADTLFTTMGLFWREDWVFWGRPKNQGRLLGVPARNLKAIPTDFREQTGIYVLYADYSLVYVGQTGLKQQRLFSRLKQHRKDDLAGRWNRFSWFGIRRAINHGQLSKDVSATHPPLKTVLDQIEGLVIHAAEPSMNGQGGRLRKSVTRYIQHKDPDATTFEEALIREIGISHGIDVKKLERRFGTSTRNQQASEDE